MSKKIGTVYETTNYSIFKKLPGNREVSPARVKAIGKSIDEYGYCYNPVMVDERMRVIDGQGRIAACMERGLPVPYIIAKGATVDDCRVMNQRQTNWKTRDFVRSYADGGNQSYKYLRQLEIEFKGIPSMAIISAAKLSGDGGGYTKHGIAAGGFEMTEEEYNRVRERLTYCQKCIDVLGDRRKFAPIQIVCGVLSFCYEHPDVDNDVMIAKLERYKREDGMLKQCRTVAQAVDEITNIYNFRNRKKILINYEYESWKMTRGGDRKWFWTIDPKDHKPERQYGIVTQAELKRLNSTVYARPWT